MRRPSSASWVQSRSSIGFFVGRRTEHALDGQVQETQRQLAETQRHLAENQRQLAENQRQQESTARIVEQLIRQAGGTPRNALAERALTEAVAATEARAASGDSTMQRVTTLLEAGNTLEALALLEADAERETEKQTSAAREAAARYRHIAAIAEFADPARARSALAKATSLDPENVEGQLRFGQDLFEAGYVPAARDAFERVLAKRNTGLAPLQEASALDGVGDVLSAQGNLPAALKAFRDSLAIRERLAKSDPGNAGWQADLAASHGKLGGLYAAQGDDASARKMFTAGRAIVVPFAERSGHQLWIGYLKSFDADLAKLGP